MQSLILDHLSGKTLKTIKTKLSFLKLFCLCSGSDPSQHILDTLEQCISVIIEKIQRLDQDRNESRMSSIDYNKANEGPSSNNNPVTTKILYFTNRSVTPFMST